jgi:hypothetical protein
LFTPSILFCSHHLNFVHTIYFQGHTGIILFTPSRFYSHFGKCDRKSNAKIMNMWYKTCRHHTDFHCWYDRHTQSLKIKSLWCDRAMFRYKTSSFGCDYHRWMQTCSTYDLSVLGETARHGRWSILAYSSCTGTVDVTSHRGTSVLSASLVRGIVITGLYTRSV